MLIPTQTKHGCTTRATRRARGICLLLFPLLLGAQPPPRRFREADLAAEQKKYENGLSTNFFVFAKQNDLNAARATELQARIAYAKAVTALEQAMGTLLQARGFADPS